MDETTQIAAAARVVAPAATAYRGEITRPRRWADYAARAGDVIVCTPPKSGTTWTQSITLMLLAGRTELPGRLSEISPWIDADFEPAGAMAARLDNQTGRRVIKTHTPADGFPVWEGVKLICVYRHPLDVFFSLLRHAQNMTGRPDHPMLRPLDVALGDYVGMPLAVENFDRDSLATVCRHYEMTALSDRWADKLVLHYADMHRSPREAVARIDAFLGTGRSEADQEAVARATSIGAMRDKAPTFAPEGGRGFWSSDAAFFDSGGTSKWEGRVAGDMLARYGARMDALLPGAARGWLENGGALPA